MVSKKLTAISKSGLDLLIINKNFATTKWNSYPSFLLNFSASYLTSNNLLVAVYDTDVLMSPPNIFMQSSNCSTVSTCIMLSLISIFIPNKACLFPLTTYISSKSFFTFLTMSDITARFYVTNFCHPLTRQ